MKKQKKQNLLTAIIIILIIVLVMLVGSIVYEEITNINNQQAQQTQSPDIKEEIEEDIDNSVVENEEIDIESEKEEEPQKEELPQETDPKEEYVGEEENNDQEDTNQSKEDKAINLVKKQWGNDETVTFSIEQKNGNIYYVAVKGNDTETVWYEVDTENWEINEY